LAAIKIEKLENLLEALRQLGVTTVPGFHVRFMFRGHGKESWHLEPGVYRPDFTFHQRTDIGEDEEVARLRTEQHLFQDFRVMSAGLRSGNESDVDLYFLQQHYGMPTRLLDWSNNPLAGLYFAVANKEHDADAGKFIALDAYQFAAFQGAPAEGEPHVRGVATSGRIYIREAVQVISAWKKKEDFGDYAIALRPDHLDSRMALQRSCFTFHPPKCKRLDAKTLGCLWEFEIPSGAKPHLRAELAMLGIDDFSIYGDLDHLATRLKAAYRK
jgi:hypothetical protein